MIAIDDGGLPTFTAWTVLGFGIILVIVALFSGGVTIIIAWPKIEDNVVRVSVGIFGLALLVLGLRLIYSPPLVSQPIQLPTSAPPSTQPSPAVTSIPLANNSVDVKLIGCSEDLRSRGGQPVLLTLHNETDHVRQIAWIDGRGAREWYEPLQPRDTVERWSIFGPSAWEIADGRKRCIELLLVGNGPTAEFTITR